MTPETITNGRSANLHHQASGKEKVASRNAWCRREHKLKLVSVTNETMKFEGKCDDYHIYNCADPKQAADMYTSTTKEISEYVGRTYKCGGDTRQVIMRLQLPDICPYLQQIFVKTPRMERRSSGKTDYMNT
jgi:hypothetical protein